jgi:hypothetical protein
VADDVVLIDPNDRLRRKPWLKSSVRDGIGICVFAVLAPFSCHGNHRRTVCTIKRILRTSIGKSVCLLKAREPRCIPVEGDAHLGMKHRIVVRLHLAVADLPARHCRRFIPAEWTVGGRYQWQASKRIFGQRRGCSEGGKAQNKSYCILSVQFQGLPP